MKDQVVIVTGSGQGIGEATALRFSREGASVVVVDIQEASGNETVQEIQLKVAKRVLSGLMCQTPAMCVTW